MLSHGRIRVSHSAWRKQTLEIRRTRIDRLERGDVLVRIMASGLCHTDLEVIEGSLAYPMPIVLGTRAPGVVEAVGEDGDRREAGRPRRLLVEPRIAATASTASATSRSCASRSPTTSRAAICSTARSRLTCESAKVHHFSSVSSHAQVRGRAAVGRGHGTEGDPVR
jgi:S-(hydroxymethyl)glutathione dehydrogenase/alcohol dehydrogenase